MKATRAAACTLLVLELACTGARGPAGAPGPTGEAGATGGTGPRGPKAPVTGLIQGKVTSATTGQPLAGASILGPQEGLSTITASDGTFSLSKLAEGVYALNVADSGYLEQTVTVSVGVNTTTHVSIALATDTASSGGLSVALEDNFLAGFGATVMLTAHVTAADADAAAVTYAWTQTGGTPAAGLTGVSTQSISFHTLTLADAKLEANPSAAIGVYDGGGLVPARFGPMSIGIDETGNYQLSVTVTDAAGHTVTTSATVWTTPPTSGLRSVPLGLPVWFEGDSVAADGGARTSWSFELTPPPGSTATLTGATSQFPFFTPDVHGSYVVTDAVSGTTATVYGATWDGISGIPSQPGTGNDYVVQGCTSVCHIDPPQFPTNPAPGTAPDMFKYWASTPHASAFADGIDGKLGPTFGPSCLSCHTLGDSPAANNGGFGNVAAADSWSFPATLAPGNYANLVAENPALAQLTNVQCESCHGPKNLDVMGVDDTAAMSFGAGVCATCHSEGVQWKQSLHANLQVAINEGSTDGPAPASCARCHTAQGFAEYTQELNAGCAAAGSHGCLLTSDGNPPVDGGTNAADGGTYARLGLTPGTVQSQTCAGCHDPHDVAGLPFQLRVYDSVPTTLMNGLAVSSVGAGAACMVCHNAINDVSVATSTLTASSTLLLPHNATQTDVLYGVNAYFMPQSNPSPHLAVTDTCVGCHYAIPTAAEKEAGQTTNHAFTTDLSICSTCHSAAFDGAVLQAQTTAQLNQLDEAIFAAIQTLLGAAGTYNTTFRDAATLNYLCVTGSGAPNVYLPVSLVPSTLSPFTTSAGPPVHATPWRNLGSVLVTFAANPFSGVAGLGECTGTASPAIVPNVNYAGGPVVLSVSAAQAGSTHSSLSPPIVSAISITGQSIYNEALLNNDLSLGIHNLSFTEELVANTLAKLAAVTPTNP